MKLNNKGLLIVISGPSGVGKSTVRKALFDIPYNNLVYSVSMTTRVARENEVNGIDYFFVSKKQFEKQIQEGKLLEYAYFVGNFYGTPLDEVKKQLENGKEVLLEIEVEGALQVKKKIPDCVLIFLVPPTREHLIKRISSRMSEMSNDIAERLKKAESEFGLAHKYDYIVVNDSVENAADRIMAIIRAEHAKTQRSIYKYNELMKK